MEQVVQVNGENSDTTFHQLFFDNFFTSYNLIKRLTSQAVKATGTNRENRTNSTTKNMTSHKGLKKTRRGSLDYRCDGEVYIAKWNDNCIIHICSNYSTHLPLQKCKRNVKGFTLDVSQPNLITQYNKGMGGFDLMGRLLANLPTINPWKEMVLPLFTNMLNITMVTAWKAHCASHKTKMTHLEFFVTTLTLMNSSASNKTRAPRVAAYPPFET